MLHDLVQNVGSSPAARKAVALLFKDLFFNQVL